MTAAETFARNLADAMGERTIEGDLRRPVRPARPPRDTDRRDWRRFQLAENAYRRNLAVYLAAGDK